MKKLYIKMPYLTSIGAKIKKREYIEENTKLILDRTIFIPCDHNNDLEDGEIDGHKLLDVYEENGEIYHIIEGRPEKSDVYLKIKNLKRKRNLEYNAAIILIRLSMNKFYNRQSTFFELKDNYCKIKFKDFDQEDINIKALESFINYIIDLGLEINFMDDNYIIKSLGAINYFGVSVKNTNEIKRLKIFKYEIEKNSLSISFITGSDYQNYQLKNERILNDIKDIAISNDLASDKVSKIINKVSEQDFLSK